MTDSKKDMKYTSTRDKFLGLSLESTRKSYYPQLQKQLEISLENERHLQMLVDNLPARISYVDLDERYVFVNSGYEETFGLPREKIVGERIQTVIGPKNYSHAKHHIRNALDGQSVNYQIEFTGMNDRIRWLDITYVPDTDQKGKVNGFYVLVLDITERKRTEEEKAKLETTLQQIQKREAIGTLAGGIAHDFNNILMGILGRSSLMAAEPELSHHHKEHLQAIEKYVRSAMHLTKQLLGFARGGKYEVKPLDINHLVTSSATMFGRTRKEINIHIKLDRSAPVAEADRSQIEQVLLNMYVNAWQAMPEGGDLFLETRIVILGDDYCRPHAIAPGRYIKVSVTDQGIGMDEAISQRVFDPFFTTKKKSRGAGLGLASAYGIIKNHGGLITVHSEVGVGTTFNVYLPFSEEEAHNQIEIEEQLAHGSGTILLVDDEDMILSVGKAMLERLGYQVVTAMGGETAVEVISTMGSDIDLVILDLVMPGADGGWTFEQIQKIEPNMRVVISSGYAIDGKANEIMQKGCHGFIQKPFNLHELSQLLQSVL
jgi:two-component system cell cycle sensor histidine kinase/response regulator CckA